MSRGETPDEIFRRIGYDPKLTPHSTTGFHGTSEDNGGDIKRNGFDFDRCKCGLFGRGAYFYEDKPHPGAKAAVYFIQKWRKHPNVAVIVANLAMQEAFDLISAEENRNFFNTLQQILIDMAMERGVISSLDPTTIGTATVEFIVKYCSAAHKMQGVRATFRMPEFNPSFQQGACVREAKCISIVEKISVN